MCLVKDKRRGFILLSEKSPSPVASDFSVVNTAAFYSTPLSDSCQKAWGSSF